MRPIYDERGIEYVTQIEGVARLVRAAQALREAYDRMDTCAILDEDYPPMDDVWAAIDYIEGTRR